MTFADNDIALKVVKEKYPQAQDIRIIEHGYDNLVILVDNDYAVRFPRMSSAYIRSKYEREVLQELSSFNDVPIPKVVESGENPPHLVTTFLRGKHISASEINTFPESQQKELGEKIAIFAHAMHTTMSVQKAMQLREQLNLDNLQEEPWPIYSEKRLTKTVVENTIQKNLLNEYYERWKSLQYTTPLVVVHDDLHTQNLLFENGQLTGVLDFGDTNIGSPEQELRQLFRINTIVMDAAMQKYNELSGHTLNPEAIKIWSIVQEMATYAGHLHDNDTNHPAFIRAAKNLSSWLPEGEWASNLKEHNEHILQ